MLFLVGLGLGEVLSDEHAQISVHFAELVEELAEQRDRQPGVFVPGRKIVDLAGALVEGTQGGLLKGRRVAHRAVSYQSGGKVSVVIGYRSDPPAKLTSPR